MAGLVEYVNKKLPGNPHTWQGEGYGAVTEDWTRVHPKADPLPEGVPAPDFTPEPEPAPSK